MAVLDPEDEWNGLIDDVFGTHLLGTQAETVQPPPVTEHGGPAAMVERSQVPFGPARRDVQCGQFADGLVVAWLWPPAQIGGQLRLPDMQGRAV
jgi:hypothetical protein